MNIDINLLPEELRPKPLIDRRMLIVVVVVVALACASYYVYSLKASVETEVASVESRVEVTQREATAMSSNPDALAMLTDISQKKAVYAELEVSGKDYEQFAATKIEWGDVVARVSARVPSYVTIAVIAEGGGSDVEVGGVATTYQRVAAYASSLESDEAFSEVHTRDWDASSGEFVLILEVAERGAQ